MPFEWKVETKLDLEYFNKRKYFKDIAKSFVRSRKLDFKGRKELAARLLYVNQERIFSGKDVADLKKSTIFRKRHEGEGTKPLVATGGLLDSLRTVVGKKGDRSIRLHFSGSDWRGTRYDTIASYLTKGFKGPFWNEPKSGKYFVFWGKAFPVEYYKGYGERKGSAGKGTDVITRKRTYLSPAMRPRRLLLNGDEIVKVAREFFETPRKMAPVIAEREVVSGTREEKLRKIAELEDEITRTYIEAFKEEELEKEESWD